jgi:hypothetical protein
VADRCSAGFCNPATGACFAGEVVAWNLSVIGVSGVLAGVQPLVLMKLFENPGFVSACGASLAVDGGFLAA